MAERIELNVNDELRVVSADEATPLVYVLRNDLGLKGARLGCGANQCGACYVLIDGHAVASCDTPLWAAVGKRITTVEGLGTPERPHPLQRALIAEQASQCGYCLSGIIISAKALLDRDPTPTRAEIAKALDDNICRCGSHNRILRAVENAAAAHRQGAAS